MRSRFHPTHMTFLYGFIISGSLQAQAVHDGIWWLARTKRERIVFLEGCLNELIYDAEIKHKGLSSPSNLEEKITAFYMKGGDVSSNLVIPVMFQVGSQEADPEEEPLSGGENYSGKYGYCDGEFFRQMANRNRRKCFIEGYLECQKQYGKPEGTYAQSSDWYLDQLYQWFGISDGSDEINPDRTDFKIAEVLQAVNQAGGAANAQVARPRTAPSIQKTQPSKKTKRKGKQLPRESRVP